MKDNEGIDWFENSIKATKANRFYCIDKKEIYPTYNENSWGLTSCVGPNGYKAYGAQPCFMNIEMENDGTVAPCGAVRFNCIYTKRIYKSNGIFL